MKELSNLAPHPFLFKAQDENSNQEMYFESPKEAYEWMIYHQNWILKNASLLFGHFH
jgi:hypothetical protein